MKLKTLFGGVVIANNGFDKVRANEALAEGRADLIAFGKPFIANPDLVIRLFLDAPLMPANRETFLEELSRATRTIRSCAWLSRTPATSITLKLLGVDAAEFG
jgi:2,4-dienoyl-CoA reductase-like NADH-dependent reductase (Old Yellow Enzyme family)